MRARFLVRQLREIADIRAVQHRAAELDAMHAADRVDTGKRELSQRSEQVDLAEAGWRQTLDRGAIGDPTAQAWSAAILLGIEASNEAKERLEALRTACAQAERRWREAGSRHRLATEFATMASQRLAARLQEDRDSEAADLHLVRRGRL